MAEEKCLSLKKRQKQAVKLNAQKEIAKSLEFLDQNADVDIELLVKSKKKLESYQSTLSELDSEILLSFEEEEKIDKESALSFEFDEKLLDAIESLSARIGKMEANLSRGYLNQESASISSEKLHANVKLPKLQMSHFNGDALKWQEFWDSYENSVHANDELSPVDKFTYLRSFLTGDALRIADGYRLTSANYDAVINTLRERFGNPQIAIFAHFDAMLAIPPANHELPQLQKVFDNCERHIRSLVALGLPEETFGQVFTPIVLSKLPKYVRMELHRRNGSDAWTLSKLRGLLKDEIHAREMSQRVISSSQPANDSKNERNFKEETVPHGDNKPRKLQKVLPTSSSLISSNRTMRCSYCSEDHYSDQCQKYADVSSRRIQLKDRCLLCLGRGHQARKCVNRKTCVYCNSSGHHRSLCEQKFKGRQPPKKPNVSLQVDGTNVSAPEYIPTSGTATLLSHGEHCILQTAVADIAGQTSIKSSRLLMDTGCSRSFITTQLCREIGARYKGEEEISIAGFSDKRRKTVKYKIFEFEVVKLDGCRTTLTANAVDTITCPIQKMPIVAAKHPIVKIIPLAEPIVSKPQMVNIDILVGGDYYYDFVQSEQIKCNEGLVFLGSTLGYIAAGRMRTDEAKDTATSLLLSRVDTMPPSNFDLERFWKLEDIGISDKVSSEDDEAALQFFNDTVQFNNGRYEVKWPWKNGSPELADNYALSRGRLVSLVKRLSTSTETLERYDNTIQEQLTMGIIEKAPTEVDGDVVYYMPHHCVITPQKTTTKLRIVYDASSKVSSEMSLNDCIYRGPVLLADLCGLLLRFRKYQIGMISDIEKAFLQVVLQKPDRDATRFLWLKDIHSTTTNDNIVPYRFCRVPFGVNASPFLLAGTIAHHLSKVGSETAKHISNNVYVDNVISGKDSVEGAKRYYTEAKHIFSTASMNLREWYSNDDSVMTSIAEKDRGSGDKTSVLGLQWTLKNDTLACSVRQFSHEVSTKRKFIQVLASAFDPLGLCAPIVIKGKIILQEIWKRKYDWDAPLPEDILTDVKDFLDDFRKIPTLTMDRKYFGTGIDKYRNYELHCFTDASAKAYCAVVYLRTENEHEPSVSLVMSKCRVSPLKTLTIPKLELMAIVVGVRLLKFVEEELKLLFTRKYLWSDSQCALHWILGKDVSTVFVRNRVREVRKTKDVAFRYVPTDSNPADLPSRGMKFQRFSTADIWWRGPYWLRCSNSSWPSSTICCSRNIKPDGEEDVRKEKEEQDACQLSVVVQDPKSLLDASKISTLKKLLRVTCLINRFVNKCRRHTVVSGPLTAGEMSKAKTFWDRHTQKNAFHNLNSTACRPMRKQLGLFEDPNGLIRCRGRFEHACSAETAKTPILLPGKANSYTHLIIKDCHVRLAHAGVKHTLAEIRQHYWLLNSRNEIKKALRDCRVCRRVAGQCFKAPPEPPLPDFRTNPSAPFECTGIDYLGPLHIRSKNGELSKVWICLFTCAVVRAVHLEVVEDMTTFQFFLCLRRFIAEFGVPKLIVSDNAKQFRAGQRTLNNLWKEALQANDVQSYSSANGISWKFIPEMSPWMGGFYERMVGVTKQSLKRVLDRKTISLIELQTLVVEISAIINSRPLVYQENEIGDIPLTPAQLLRNATDHFYRLPLTLMQSSFRKIRLRMT